MTGIFVSFMCKNDKKMGKKIYLVDLSLSERVHLEDVVKRRKNSSEAAKQSLILLAADRNGTQQ